MKKSLILFLTFVVFIVPLTVMAIEWGNRPQIKDFSIKKINGRILFNFSFFNVDGGVENAEFVFIVAIYRENVLVKVSPYVVGLNVKDKNHEVTNISGDISRGNFRFEGKIDLLSKFRKGYSVIYYIMLTDSLGRTSNVVRYEFVNNWIDI